MAYITFERTNVDRILRRPVLRKDLTDCTCFNGVTNGRASAVCLEIARRSVVKTGAIVGLPNKVDLRRFCWLSDTRRLSVLIRCCTANDCPNSVSVSDSIRYTFQDYNTKAFPTRVTVGPVVEAIALTVRREKAKTGKRNDGIWIIEKIAAAYNSLSLVVSHFIRRKRRVTNHGDFPQSKTLAR